MSISLESASDATPPFRRADAKRNRKLILDAAKTAFARDGVDASLDEIARSAGVGPATLYRHFPTREHLLCEVLHERQADLLSRRDEALARPDAGEGLRLWMAALTDYLGAFNGLPRPFVEAFEAQASPLAVNCRSLVSITEEFLVHARSQGATRPFVSAPALFLSALGAAFVHDKARDYCVSPQLVEDIQAHGYLGDTQAASAPNPKEPK